jgi:hypothetical protein
MSMRDVMQHNVDHADAASIRRATDEPAHPGMIWIPGGTYRMGSDQHYPEEAPSHRVTVDGFWIDRTAAIAKNTLAAKPICPQVLRNSRPVAWMKRSPSCGLFIQGKPP